MHGIVPASRGDSSLLSNPTFGEFTSPHSDQKSDFLRCQQLKPLRTTSCIGLKSKKKSEKSALENWQQESCVSDEVTLFACRKLG